MGPRGDRRRLLGIAALAGALAWLGSAAAAAPGESAPELLARAKELAIEGRHEEALVVLREARTLFASSDLLPEILLQSARSARALGDQFRSRYFLAEVLRASPLGVPAFEAGRELAELYMADRLYREAFESLRTASLAAAGAPIDAQAVYLRLAEVAALHLGDAAKAREYVRLVEPGRLSREDRALYELVLSRSRWEILPMSTFGLEDPNVSALAADADDLWIGTWSGGLARFSLSGRSSTVFREGVESLVANTVRAICVTDRHVWVGTDQGLSQYSKALSRWRTIEAFSEPTPMKVQAVVEAAGGIWVATLGDGLWRSREDSWRRVGGDSIPTGYITSLGRAPDELLVGTMDHGVFLMSLDGEQVGSAPEALALAGPRNVTALRTDARGTVWVASYGEGLWEWRRPGGEVLRHTSALDLADDWVMCIGESEDAVYFGTFGGGVSIARPGRSWERFGLADGLGSMDVLVALSYRGDVYFGTLGGGISVYHEEADR